MANEPFQNQNNQVNGNNKHYSRPVQYVQRTRPPVYSNNAGHQQVGVPKVTNQIVQRPINNRVENTQPTRQQFTAPIYLNNYNGEYEDKKYRKYSLKAYNITRKFVFGSSLAVALAIAFAFIGIVSLSNNHNIAQAQSNDKGQSGFSNQIDQNSSPSNASTIEPTSAQISSYTVAAASPKYLIIPKLNIMSMITPVGLSGSNAIQSPNNIFNIGWWQNSSEPGQTGAVVLDGFTSSGLNNGTLVNLSKLKVGDTFQIEKGDSSKINYIVTGKAGLGPNGVSMEQAISPLDSTKPSLNIIACNGQSSSCPSSNSDYVIFAEQN